jgi:GTPase SAR1 family protein
MYKVSVEGHRGVGKTSLIRSICNDTACNIEIRDDTDNIQIYLSENVYGADCYILMWDTTNTSTLDIMVDPRYNNSTTTVFGNKCDIPRYVATDPELGSAMTGRGVDQLMTRIFNMIKGVKSKNVTWSIL